MARFLIKFKLQEKDASPVPPRVFNFTVTIRWQ